LLLLCAGLGLGLAYEVWTWPEVSSLRTRNPRTTAFIERHRKEAQGVPVAQQWVPYARISAHLKRAVLVAEDIEFFSHSGFALRELREATLGAISDGRLPRGASTVTQQLAKNLWLSPSRNPLRKLKEAVLTWQLEAALDKRRILELYLNVVEFGPGVYGAEAAARRYFRTAAARLTEAQAASLAAGLPNPRRWHPGSTSAAHGQRVTRIRERMDRATWLWKVL